MSVRIFSIILILKRIREDKIGFERERERALLYMTVHVIHPT